MKAGHPIAISLRWAAAGLIGGLAALSGMQLSAQGIGGHNSKAPVSYAADRIELQDRQDRVVLSGNVDINQAGLNLKAARTTVDYTNQGSLQIQRITATGGVVVTRANESARGEVAIYDFNRRVITMAGGVALRRGTDTLNGARLTMDLNTGISSVDGRGGGARGSGGRVSGTFSAPK